MRNIVNTLQETELNIESSEDFNKNGEEKRRIGF